MPQTLKLVSTFYEMAVQVQTLINDVLISASGFADGFPFLLTLESSLEELNKSLDHSIPMNRFRPK